jgi:exo-beta-1,3-glucanase (GH17 family)
VAPSHNVHQAVSTAAERPRSQIGPLFDTNHLAAQHGRELAGWTNMSATSPSIRLVLTAKGDAGKQVWLTDVGCPSNTTIVTGINGTTA